MLQWAEARYRPLPAAGGLRAAARTSPYIIFCNDRESIGVGNRESILITAMELKQSFKIKADELEKGEGDTCREAKRKRSEKK